MFTREATSAPPPSNGCHTPSQTAPCHPQQPSASCRPLDAYKTRSVTRHRTRPSHSERVVWVCVFWTWLCYFCKDDILLQLNTKAVILSHPEETSLPRRYYSYYFILFYFYNNENYFFCFLPSVLWCCWSGDMMGIRRVKTSASQPFIVCR